MEVHIVSEDKELLEVEIKDENHTLCNLIRDELWNSEDTSFASYNLRHPSISNPIIALKTKKGKPRKVMLDAVESLKNKTKEVKSLLIKIQK